MITYYDKVRLITVDHCEVIRFEEKYRGKFHRIKEGPNGNAYMVSEKLVIELEVSSAFQVEKLSEVLKRDREAGVSAPILVDSIDSIKFSS